MTVFFMSSFLTKQVLGMKWLVWVIGKIRITGSCRFINNENTWFGYRKSGKG